MSTKQIENTAAEIKPRIDGVVIGIFLSINDAGDPLVAFAGNPIETAVPARSTTQLNANDIGKEVALLFEDGDPRQPMIIGKIHHSESEITERQGNQSAAELDGENIVLSAKQDITLKCGKASITLTKAGKILIRGAYLLSRSSGANRIKGGSVQIN